MRKYKVTIQPKRLNWRKNPMYDKNYYFDSARKQWFVDGKPWDSGVIPGYPARVHRVEHQNTCIGPNAGRSTKAPLDPDGLISNCPRHLSRADVRNGPHSLCPSCRNSTICQYNVGDPVSQQIIEMAKEQWAESHPVPDESSAGISVPLAPGDPGIPPSVDPIHVTTMLGGDGYAHQSWPAWAEQEAVSYNTIVCGSPLPTQSTS